MGLPEDLHRAMLEVGHAALRFEIPLAQMVIDAAEGSLDLWRYDERAMYRFAALVLAGPTDLRETTRQLPEPVAVASWRLIALLEYLASHERE